MAEGCFELEEVRLESVKNGSLSANLGLLSNLASLDREALAQRKLRNRCSCRFLFGTYRDRIWGTGRHATTCATFDPKLLVVET